MAEQTQQTKSPLRRPVVQYSAQQPEEKKERITLELGISMIVVALFVDLLALIPIINLSILAASYVGFFIWFKTRNVIFTKNIKTFGTIGISAIIKLFLSFLPAFTLGVATLIIITRAEDKGGMLGKVVNMAGRK